MLVRHYVIAGFVNSMPPIWRRWSMTHILLCGILQCLLSWHQPVRSASAHATPGVETTVPISDKCWIFTHLQKCGGTTVKNILHDYWGPKFTIYDSAQWKQGEAFTESFASTLASEAGWTIAAGGYPEALRRTTAVGADDKCQWFTVFRHPVSRMVSAYYYCREDPTDQLCASHFTLSTLVDLATFAKHWGNFAVRQFALSLMSFDDVTDYLLSPEGGGLTKEKVLPIPGWYMLKLYLDDQDGAGYGDIPDAAMYEMLRPVQELIRDRYAVVGILEQFNTTLSLLDAALDMPGLDWHKAFERRGKENVDARFERQKQEAIVEALTDSEIKKYIRLDLLLYEHAVDVFRDQAKLYGLE